MALLLALAANVGVGTMVESFRRTFLGYLDQRLAAELYVTARDDAEAAAIADWLAARPEVAAVLPTATARTRVADWPVDVVGFRDHATYRDNWPLARRRARRLGPGRRAARRRSSPSSSPAASTSGPARPSRCRPRAAPGACRSPPSTPTTATPKAR